jgi:hypothetical protein
MWSSNDRGGSHRLVESKTVSVREHRTVAVVLDTTMSEHASPALKAGVTDGDYAQCNDVEWCPGPLARPTNGNPRCFECFRVAKRARMERATERARMHAAQALTRADEEPAQAREHLRETLQLLDAVQEEL